MKAFPCEYMEWNPDAEYVMVSDPFADPVFTQPMKGQWENRKSTGMDLRDYFAARAMQANLSSPEFLQVVTAEQANGKSCAERVAKISYLYADAMMEAREK